MPEVICSIIIPVYNGEQFLEKTIRSCLDQTLIDNIEIIVIDDCSKDNSFKIIQALASKHRCIVAFKNEHNSGINKSLNKAAAIAKGKYILFLGHDDLLRPSHVEIMLNEFDNDTSFVHCNSDLINKDDDIYGVAVDDIIQIKRTKRIKESLAIKNVIHSTGAIINKKYFDLIGGWNEQFKNYGEWLLWIKLVHVGKVKYCTKTRAMYRRHDTNITNTFTDEKVKISLKYFHNHCKKTALELFQPNLFTRTKIDFIIKTTNVYRFLKKFL